MATVLLGSTNFLGAIKMGPGLNVEFLLEVFNRAQQAYYLENNEFASDLTLLENNEVLELLNNYSEYELVAEEYYVSFLYKPNVSLGSPSYYAFVGAWTDGENLLSSGFLFRSSTFGPHDVLSPPTYSAIPPTVGDGSLISPPTSGTTTFVEIV
jgi:hypothetical protein